MRSRNRLLLTPESLTKLLTDVCNETLKPSNGGTRRKPMYWWNSKVAEASKEYIRKRRILTRQRKKSSPYDILTMEEDLAQARRQLRGEIKESKKCGVAGVMRGS